MKTDFEPPWRLLQKIYEQAGDLGSIADSTELRSFISSSLFAEKMKRFEDNTYNPQETAGLYEDNTVVYVAQSGHWSVNLVRHASQAKAIYALPFPSLIGPAGEQDGCVLDIYTYPAQVNRDLANAANAYAKFVRSVNLKKGEYWHSSIDEPAYCLSYQTPNTTFIRIIGPLTAPILMLFAKTTLNTRILASPRQK